MQEKSGFLEYLRVELRRNLRCFFYESQSFELSVRNDETNSNSYYFIFSVDTTKSS